MEGWFSGAVDGGAEAVLAERVRRRANWDRMGVGPGRAAGEAPAAPLGGTAVEGDRAMGSASRCTAAGDFRIDWLSRCNEASYSFARSTTKA